MLAVRAVAAASPAPAAGNMLLRWYSAPQVKISNIMRAIVLVLCCVAATLAAAPAPAPSGAGMTRHSGRILSAWHLSVVLSLSTHNSKASSKCPVCAVYCSCCTA